MKMIIPLETDISLTLFLFLSFSSRLFVIIHKNCITMIISDDRMQITNVRALRDNCSMCRNLDLFFFACLSLLVNEFGKSFFLT